MSNYLDYDDTDEYGFGKNKLYKATDAEIAEEGVSSITRRVHDASAIAEFISYVIRTLRAVNMDRLADKVESVQIGIINILEPIPRIVYNDVRGQIDHSKHMIGGFLELVLTKDIVPKKANSGNGETDAVQN